MIPVFIGQGFVFLKQKLDNSTVSRVIDRYMRYVSKSAMILSAFLILLGLLVISCRTEIPFEEDFDDMVGNPADTTMTDTTSVPIDTSTMQPDVPCDSTIIYFDQQILPIFQGSCAYSGCHDAASAKEGIILDSYENIIRRDEEDLIIPFNAGKSEIFEKITEDDPDDIMPPPPNNALSEEQILLISTWIEQGAENLSCESNIACDTSDVSYSQQIAPIFDTKCKGCHGSSNPNAGLNFLDYSTVASTAKSGRLLGALTWSDGYVKMPQAMEQLPACDLNLIQAWIDQGASNN